MTNPIAPASGEIDATEVLLQSLIGECGDIIRTVILPAIARQRDEHERRYYLQSVVSLVEISASVGDTIARLRGGGARETRQRIIVERLGTAPALPSPRGEGA